MIGLLSILALGFFLGMRHATDPDHVVAVTAILTRQNKVSRAALTGLSWGIGHTLTIFVVGAAIILFGIAIPARIGLSMELAVAVMLILLGWMNISSFFRDVPNAIVQAASADPALPSSGHTHIRLVHSHSHEPGIHAHTHAEDSLARLDRWLGRLPFFPHLRPLLVGVVHGLAGSAAVALLVLAAIRDPRWAIGYLLVFGAGTIAGMMLITMSMASAFHFVGGSGTGFSRRLSVASGFISLLFGLAIAYQICVVHGLFTGNPQWMPR